MSSRLDRHGLTCTIGMVVYLCQTGIENEYGKAPPGGMSSVSTGVDADSDAMYSKRETSRTVAIIAGAAGPDE